MLACLRSFHKIAPTLARLFAAPTSTDILHKEIQNFYGKKDQEIGEFIGNSFCYTKHDEERLKPYLDNIPKDIIDRSFSCGYSIPPLLKHCYCLDLGCGAGRDVYVMSQLVGKHGRVFGVDMTPELITLAKSHKSELMKKFGYKISNVQFRKGYLESLGGLIIGNQIDLVTSNCSLNLSTSKDQVFEEIHRMLKPGAECYISEFFVDRRLPASAKKDSFLYDQGVSGALYFHDFRHMMYNAGFHHYNVVSAKKVEITDPEYKKKLGDANLYSKVVRIFKLPLDEYEEDYQQVATYNGNIDNLDEFIFAENIVFPKGVPVHVSKNTADILRRSRYNVGFDVSDEKDHIGEFDPKRYENVNPNPLPSN